MKDLHLTYKTWTTTETKKKKGPSVLLVVIMSLWHLENIKNNLKVKPRYSSRVTW